MYIASFYATFLELSISLIFCSSSSSIYIFYEPWNYYDSNFSLVKSSKVLSIFITRLKNFVTYVVSKICDFITYNHNTLILLIFSFNLCKLSKDSSFFRLYGSTSKTNLNRVKTRFLLFFIKHSTEFGNSIHLNITFQSI